jgi:F-type H+-transporting ATPase subunit epsilon
MSAPSEHMRLEVFTPTALLVDDAAVKVIAEGPEGYLLVYVTAAGEERLLGIDEGVLVKRGAEVRVSVLDAFESDDLASLRKQVARRFLSLDEHERSARTALARLEAGAIRHVLEIER